MSSRTASIDAVLDRSRRDVETVKKRYEASLSAKHIDPDLRIDIKSLCENLRSALDYLAQDIRAKHCPGADPRVRFYFPILPTGGEFKQKMASWFPGLATNSPDLWTYLETVQPYHDGQGWLGHFNRVNVENKHGDLLEQTRIESERVTVSGPGGGQVSWDPGAVRFGPGVSIGGVPVDPRTQLPVPHPSQRVDRVTWVDFHFAGTSDSVLQLLQSAVTGVAEIVRNAREWL
jgi:hypothetical protein